MSNHCQTLLAILDDGQWHTLREIQAAAFEIQGEPMTVHSRAAQLRKQGYVIANESTPFGGATASRYRLVASPNELAEARAVSLPTPEEDTGPEETAAGSSGFFSPPSGAGNENWHASEEAHAKRDAAGERAPSAASRPGEEGTEPEPPPEQMSLDQAAA